MRSSRSFLMATAAMMSLANSPMLRAMDTGVRPASPSARRQVQVIRTRQPKSAEVREWNAAVDAKRKARQAAKAERRGRQS